MKHDWRRLQRAAALGLSGALLLLAGCGSGGAAKPALTAAERLTKASVVIAPRFGTSADDVARNFKTKFATLTEAQLADEAEATARRTAWLDDALARMAERAKSAKAVQRSTCKLIESYDTLVALSEADQAVEIQSIILGELRRQGLSETEQNVAAVADAIAKQVAALKATGSVDLQSMYSDLFCLLET